MIKTNLKKITNLIILEKMSNNVHFCSFKKELTIWKKVPTVFVFAQSLTEMWVHLLNNWYVWFSPKVLLLESLPDYSLSLILKSFQNFLFFYLAWSKGSSKSAIKKSVPSYSRHFKRSTCRDTSCQRRRHWRCYSRSRWRRRIS